MASNYTYHRILPQNAKAGYTEFDVVDFQMSFPARSLLLGTVRLEGSVDVTVDSLTLDNNANASKNVVFDCDVGGHTFIENITTNIGGSVVESLGDYARYVKMSAVAMTSIDDNSNSSAVCELKACSDQQTNDILKGEFPPVDPDAGTAIRVSPDFSIKPRICLNGGVGTLAHRRSGDITLSINLARNYSALFGADVGATTQYTLKDLRLTFNSVPDDMKNVPVSMRTKINIKQSIQSSQANVNVRVPAVCDSVSCSFQVQAFENTPGNDNQILHQVPLLSATQFIFNDSTNSLVSYQIRNNAELIDRAIASFVDADKNTLGTTRLANGNGFMIGLNFDEVIDLSNQKFSIELNSDVSNLIPLVMYMYFHSFIKL